MCPSVLYAPQKAELRCMPLPMYKGSPNQRDPSCLLKMGDLVFSCALAATVSAQPRANFNYRLQIQASLRWRALAVRKRGHSHDCMYGGRREPLSLVVGTRSGASKSEKIRSIPENFPGAGTAGVMNNLYKRSSSTF